ncbi:hypothetical protein HOO34_08300 [Aliarcobacter cryaerophilus]|uniref:Uncharacterized protein n=1 Tax=Aliarcobacter cryaerophilus TaxID=28198 RepID=A0A2S9SRY3_9BACT|nr:hypothetical protein [Aliarcobacter cryaerophilus]PRM89355.1 hypothetical protein CJ669_02355 [Aliarcobacter cryaerophilus]QNM89634.1 hypothetical protein HOO34_08300 [Aliarcobacter cryaerophilus]
MKIKKLLQDIENFFYSTNKEENYLYEALLKIEDKEKKLKNKILFNDFDDEKQENLQEKLQMIRQIKIKIEKKLKKIKTKNSTM